MVISHAAIKVVDIKDFTVSSILNAIRKLFLLKVASIEYDPNRTAYIALLNYKDGEKRYIIAPQGLKIGDVVTNHDEGAFNPGCCMRLKMMPLGSTIHNIEIHPGRGGQFVRSAGLSAQLMAKVTAMLLYECHLAKFEWSMKIAGQHLVLFLIQSESSCRRQGRKIPLEGNSSNGSRYRDEPC